MLFLFFKVATSLQVYFESPNRKRDVGRVRFAAADEKPLIGVSCAHGLNEPRSGAFLSSDTGGEQTEQDSPPLLPPAAASVLLSSSVYARPPSLLSLSPSSCVFWILSPIALEPGLDRSFPPTHVISSVVQVKAAVVMPG